MRSEYQVINKEKETMVFAHANGYAPQAYVELHDSLRDTVNLHSIEFTPLQYGTDHSGAKDWHFFKNELIEFVESNFDKPVVGMGHSLGAISTLLAVNERPDLFSKIILLDPVLLPKHMLRWTFLLPLWIKKKYVPVSKIALKRKDVFNNKKEVFEYYRTKNVFKRLSDKTLRAYIDSGFVHIGEQVTLRYTKEWESHVYATIVNSWPFIPQVNIPTLAIRGVESDVINDKSWHHWQDIHNQTSFVEIPDAGHLVPLEQPVAVANAVKDWMFRMV